jgi:signal transduction histidine kinase/predicted transcriptional regulator
MKILTKTIVLSFTLIMIASVTTIGISEIISKNIVEQEVYNHLLTTADSRADHIETFLKTEKEAVEQLSASIVIEQFLSAEKDDPDYTQKRNVVMRRLKDTADVREDTDSIFVLDKNGIIVASNKETDIGKDKSNNSYFLYAKEGAFVKDAYVSSTGKDSIAFSAPVFDEDRVLLGVVVARVPMEILNKITTDRTGLGETGEIYIINKDGYMITPSRFVNDTFLKLKVDTENARDYFGEHEHEQVIYKNYMGTEVLGVPAHIPDMDWCLLAEMDIEEAFAPVTWLTQTLLSILALLSVLGFILSILIAQRVIRPIVELHHGTEEITKGNWDYKVGTKARDEIGVLSRTFDSMTAELKKSKAELEEYSSGLEEKVEERTKELVEEVKESEEQAIATLSLLEDVNETKNKLESSQQAILNMAQDLGTEKRETESAKHALEATNIKLERSNKELQDFTYIASHDLREPLRKVSAFGQLLQESLKGKLDEDEEENFAFMIDGATRMQQMVNDLLVFSRVTTTAEPPERVDLNEVIKNLKDVELAVQLEETGGVINVPEPLPPVVADPSQIHQLLQNLIGNGLKYSRKGVAPVVTVRSRQEAGKTVRIEVQDNGIGIKEEYYANIFGMFKRLQSHEDYEGSGIGLAVCKKIVERHGGEIGVESNLDEGSTFWFTVPITLSVTGAEIELERNRWGIMFDILRGIFVTEGVQKPKFDLMSDKRYFKFLRDTGFLEACDEPGEEECYKLTEEGQDLLWKLQEVAAMVRGKGRGRG